MTRARFSAAVSLAVMLAASALFASNGIASSGPVSISELAPADEYFGREKISPLGIRHEIFTLKDDLHHARQRPDAVEHKAELVENAVDDWLARYPDDTWIPSAAWQLATLYEELPGPQAREHALVVLALVKDRFSNTPFGTYAANDLSRGIGVRPWPRWAASPSAPPAAPAASPATQIAPAIDANSLVRAILSVPATPAPANVASIQQLEDRFWALSRGGTDAAYTRAAWELAAAFERLPGQDSKTQAIRLLALLVDRYPTQIYGKWAMRDLQRGVGQRS